MRLIKLYTLQDEKPIYINIEQIGHIYEVEKTMAYGKIDKPKHTRIGVTTHNLVILLLWECPLELPQ